MRLMGVYIAGFLVVPKREHYLIYKNERFLQSCDCGELNGTIEELLKEVG